MKCPKDDYTLDELGGAVVENTDYRFFTCPGCWLRYVLVNGELKVLEDIEWKD